MSFPFTFFMLLCACLLVLPTTGWMLQLQASPQGLLFLTSLFATVAEATSFSSSGVFPMQVPGRLNNARGSAFPTKTSHTMHQRRMSTRLELGAASRIADGLDAQNGVVTMLSSGSSSSSILSTAWLALSSLLKSATMRSDKQLSLNNYTATTFHDNISTLVMGSCMNKIRSSSLSSWFNKDVSGSSLEKKKVLILMSDTGGGHRASAQALQEALLEISNNKVMVTILDIWTKHSVWPFNKAVTTYRFLAKHPMLWRAMYRYGQFAPTRTLTELYSSCVNYKKFYKAVNDHSPDIVLSVHPLCQSLPISVLKNINAERAKDNKQRIPFVTVVTDLGSAHPTWFDNDVDACFVPSEAVLKLAISNGMPAQKVHLRGLLMRPKFWSKSALSKEKAREQLGWSKNLKTALLMGGGDGVGGMDSIATSLAEKLNSLDNTSQLVVICGHNNQLHDQLTAKLTSRRFPRLSVKVEGFVHNIDCYMSASDCLITKAGPGTIVEAMTRGLPLILSSYLPGQESGNIPYAEEGGFGVYTGNRPQDIAQKVAFLLSNDGEAVLDQMSNKAHEKCLSSGHADAARNIAQDIAGLLA